MPPPRPAAATRVWLVAALLVNQGVQEHDDLLLTGSGLVQPASYLGKPAMHLGEPATHLGTHVVDLLLNPSKAGGGLFTKGVDHRPVRACRLLMRGFWSGS